MLAHDAKDQAAVVGDRDGADPGRAQPVNDLLERRVPADGHDGRGHDVPDGIAHC